MTYFTFHLLFLVPPLVWLLARHRRWLRGHAGRSALRWIAVITGLALVYTTPWDNYLVWRGVWSYGADRVVGTIGYVPIEEYVFFVLQPLLTGLWYLLVVRWNRWSPGVERAIPVGPGAGLALGAAVAGAIMLTRPATLYMGLILVWAAPVLGLQWVLGAARMWAARRTVAVAIAAPTVYLWVADWSAIRAGIWTITPEFTVGWHLFGLPVEEALFFLVTNAMVVLGLVLFVGTRVEYASVSRPRPERVHAIQS